jgi:hypothetical protein
MVKRHLIIEHGMTVIDHSFCLTLNTETLVNVVGFFYLYPNKRKVTQLMQAFVPG